MTVTVLNPDANVESTSVDGFIRRSAVDEVFATIRAGVGILALDDDADLGVELDATATTDQYSKISRTVALFDVSGIAAGQVISGVTLAFWVNSQATTLTISGYVADSPTPASNVALVASDYNIANWADVAHSNVIAPGSISTGGYNTWTLNAAGIAVVQTALDGDGIANLGLRSNNDLANAAPSWVTGATAAIVMQSADAANPPKLSVTHADPASDPQGGSGTFEPAGPLGLYLR